MKIAVILGLMFLGLTSATQGQAEEYYRYRDPHGGLVISNKLPPPGSEVLKTLELPEAPGDQARQEARNAQANEPKPSKPVAP